MIFMNKEIHFQHNTDLNSATIKISYCIKNYSYFVIINMIFSYKMINQSNYQNETKYTQNNQYMQQRPAAGNFHSRKTFIFLQNDAFLSFIS